MNYLLYICSMERKDRIQNGHREIFVCDCHSLEHIYSMWYEEDYNQLYIEPVLSTPDNFFLRVWVAIKYIFGYKSVYGPFDSLIINVDDMPSIIEHMDIVIAEDTIRERKHNKKIKDEFENQEKERNI